MTEVALLPWTRTIQQGWNSAVVIWTQVVTEATQKSQRERREAQASYDNSIGPAEEAHDRILKAVETTQLSLKAIDLAVHPTNKLTSEPPLSSAPLASLLDCDAFIAKSVDRANVNIGHVLWERGRERSPSSAERFFNRLSGFPSQKTLLARVRSEVDQLLATASEADVYYNRVLDHAREDRDHRLSVARMAETEVLAAEQALEQAYLAASTQAGQLSGMAGLMGAPWKGRGWASWTSLASGVGAPAAMAMGWLTRSAGDPKRTLELPALVPLLGDGCVLLKAHATAKAQAAAAGQGVLLRLLALVPAGKLRITFLDPVGLGGNSAAFMRLADYDEVLVTSRAWTEPRHIEQRLAALTEHMENVIQKYLRNQYATIEEYNAEAGEVAEPYRLLVVFDFPTNFSEDAARRLISIATNGPRCGKTDRSRRPSQQAQRPPLPGSCLPGSASRSRSVTRLQRHSVARAGATCSSWVTTRRPRLG